MTEIACCPRFHGTTGGPLRLGMRRQTQLAALRRGGFTLIELLCVVAILATLAAALVLSLGNQDRTLALKSEARRLAKVMEMASDWSVRNNTELALRLEPSGYGFLAFNTAEDAWEPLSVKPFQLHVLSSWMRIDLWAEGAGGQAGGGGERGGEGRKGEQAQRASFPLQAGDEAPLLLILSSGEYTPFIISFSEQSGEARWELAGDGFGRIQVRTLDGSGEGAFDYPRR